MPGRKPTPTSLKILAGNPGHQRLPQNEPKPRPITPAMPEYLGADGQAKWNELLPELEYSGTLTIVDRDVFGRHCLAYQWMLDARQHIEDEGMTTENAAGSPILSPWVAIYNRAWDDMAKTGAELGIGAASRTHVEVRKPPPATKSALEQVREVTRRR